MNYFPSNGFIHFDSRKMAYDKLLEALKDNQINMMGLYGMGGCGKTTLVKQVAKEVEMFFEKIAFVVVSDTIDVRKIQGGIASQLGLTLEEEDELGRAKHLFMGLSIGKRFLIILDDVWEELDFEAIGIPKDERQKGCNVLITTRHCRICTLMNCQIQISIHVLNETEALTLFQRHAEISSDNFDNLKDLARDIANECGGLPIAIAVVASTLKGKHQIDWEEALETLRDSSWMDIEEGMRKIYTCLQLSYDYLNNAAAESLFLLCSIFPKDYNISVEELAMFGIGLLLAGEVGSYKRARNRIIIAKDKLIDSCLLQEANANSVIDEEKNYVKMHDLVRDVALWIARKKNKLIMRPEKSQKALQEDMIMKDDKVKYLWLDHYVDEFPNQLDCPELEFLCISTYSQSCVDVNDDFFKGMKKLKVLLLKNLGTPLKLPKSAHLINNIRCLILSQWSLGDIGFIASLEKLESLSLRNCSLDELPNSIVQQKDLRYLDLRDCEIQKNPYEAIGRCSQLEELYFCGNKGTNWEDQGEYAAEFFDQNRATLVLERYSITIGKTYVRMQENMARSLMVEYFETCISNATIKDLMQRAKVLYLKGIHSCKNVIPEVIQTIGGDMNELTKLSLYDSNEIECVINTFHIMCNVGIMFNLTHLTLRGMKNLKTLCDGQPPQGLFEKLEFLELSSCDSLEHIIMDEVREIVADDNEYDRIRGSTFSKLKRLVIGSCSQLEYLFPASFAHRFAQLESLELHGVDKLKCVFGPYYYGDKNRNEFQVIEFSALKHLTLMKLPNIITICPENYHPAWPSLQHVSLYECPQLNIMPITSSRLGQEDQIASSEDLKKAVVTQLKTVQSLDVTKNKTNVIFHMEGLPINGQQLNCGLKELLLFRLPELRHIWIGPKKVLCLQNLVELYITDCKNLKVIFPASVSRSLPQLHTLEIQNCMELEEIMEDDNENQNVSNPQLLLPHLTEIYISHCHKLKCVFPMASSSRVLPKLRVLFITEASQLEQLFGRKGQRNERMEDVNIPEMEYLTLWRVPKLTIGGELTQLQTVKYRVVHQSPTLSLTSTLTPKEMARIYNQKEGIVYLSFKEIIKSYEAEMASKIASESKHIPSQSVKGSVKEGSMSKNAKNVKEQEAQGARKGNIPQDKNVERSVEKGSTLENTEIVTSSTQSKPTSSLLCPTSLPKAFSHSLNNITGGEVPNLEIPKAIETSPMNPELINEQLSNNTLTISLDEGPSRRSELEDQRSMSKPSLTDQQQPLGEAGITNNDIPRKQIWVNQNETGIDKDIKANPMVNLQDIEDDSGQLSIPSVPIVATTKDNLVAKALVDLEVSLKMPLKDIATSEINSLCLLTNLNFLSRLSIEDRALSHGLKATIESLHLGFLSILYSFKQAFAIIKKFHEAQEKEAKLGDQISRLENEIKDCQVQLSSLQEKKKKCVAETTELEKEIESVSKEKLEMVEDQSKAEQQLFEFDHRWSVLCSQFQHNINMRSPQSIIESNEDSSGEIAKQIDNEETEGFNGGVEGSTSKNVEIVTSSTHSEPKQIKINKIERDTDKDTGTENTLVINPQDFENNNGPLPITYVPIVTTIKYDLVAKALVDLEDLEDSLKMSLKDIVSSEHKSLHLLTTLSFLSCLSLEDGDLPHGLKPIIKSLHEDLPTILYSFKQTFATIKEFHEAQEKEARLKKEISRLEIELEDSEAKLSSFQEQKKECVAKSTEVKKQIDSVRKEKSEMVENQRKAKQQLLEIDYRWSVLCSQFRLNNVAARNLS